MSSENKFNTPLLSENEQKQAQQNIQTKENILKSNLLSDDEKKTYEQSSEFSKLQEQITYFLLTKQRSEAIEEIVQHILKNEFIHSVRSQTKAEMWIYKDGVYLPFAETYIRETVRKIVGPAYTSQFVNEVLAKIESETYINQEVFFENSNIEFIPVQNGLLNIITKELKPFTHEIRFFNKLPVMFEPEKDCPAIKKHFKTVLFNEKDADVFQEMIGFCLLKDYRFEKAFMLNGGGRNGKSKTLEVIKHFLGVQNCTNISLEQIDIDKNALSNFFGKMVNIAPDINSKTLRHTSTFKALTGRDLLSAHRKYLTNLEFVNYAKMLFGCNELPITRDTTHAFFGRWILFDFPYTFVDEIKYNSLEEDERKLYKIKDPDIVPKLTTPDELSGLLNWALVGLERLLKNKKFSDSPGTHDVKNRWVRRSNSFSAFISENLTTSSEGFITKKNLNNEYREFCKKHKLKPLGAGMVNRMLGEELNAYEEVRRLAQADFGETSPERVWVGIEFLAKKTENATLEPKFTEPEPVIEENMVLEENTSTTDKIFECFNELQDAMSLVPVTGLMKTCQIYDISNEKVLEVVNHYKKKGALIEPKPGFIQKI